MSKHNVDVPVFVLQFFIATVAELLRDDPYKAVDFVKQCLGLDGSDFSSAIALKWLRIEFPELIKKSQSACDCDICVNRRYVEFMYKHSHDSDLNGDFTVPEKRGNFRIPD
jgi:hypothetical protein